MLVVLSRIEANGQLLHFHLQSIAKIDAQLEQIVNTLSRGEEGKLPSQPVVNNKGHCMVDESTSYHEQAITTMSSGKVVENHMKERKEEQIVAPQDLHQAKFKEVSTEASSSSTPILEMPYVPQVPIPGNLKSSSSGTDDTLLVIIAYDLLRGQESSLLEEQKETIEVENSLSILLILFQFMIPYETV